MKDSTKLWIEGIAYNVLPYKLYCKAKFWYHCKKNLNVKDPVTYTEKLWYLIKYNKKHNFDLLQQCYDKYRVREYVENKIGGTFLNKLYGVYDNAEEIDFSELPERFVLKITQSCGCNIIVKNKAELDYTHIKNKLNAWLKITNSWISRQSGEGFLFDGNAKIICEEYLHNDKDEIPDDIRIFCFNGVPKFVCYDIDSTDSSGNKKKAYCRNTYDTDWNLIPVDLGRQRDESVLIKKPVKLKEMLEIASALSQEFKFVRVDLYNLEDRIVFGELTWTPQSGCGIVTPKFYDLEFGKMLDVQ